MICARNCVVRFVAVMWCFGAFAQNAVFTYQGLVNDQGTNFTGAGQFEFALVPPGSQQPATNVWSNDGTTAGQPSNFVSVPVSNGIFTVTLGDTNLVNMNAISASLFAQTNLQLQIWFNDGVNGFAALSPAQTLTPTPYATVAANVSGLLPASSISGTLAVSQLPPQVLTNNATNVQLNGTFLGDGRGLTNLSGAALAPGTITASQLAPGTAAANTLNGGPDILSISDNLVPPSGKSGGYNLWQMRSVITHTDAFAQTNWFVPQGCPMQYWRGDPNFLTLVPPTTSGAPEAPSGTFSFGFEGSDLYILMRGSEAYCWVATDNRWPLEPQIVQYGADGNYHYYYVQFSSYARRQVSLQFEQNWFFGGVFIRQTNGLWNPILTIPNRLAIFGDSITERRYPQYLKRILPNSDVWPSAEGGTGYYQTGTSVGANGIAASAYGHLSMVQRVTNDIAILNPTHVLFCLGINDRVICWNDSTSQPDPNGSNMVYNAALTCYQAVQAYNPNIKIAVCLPFWASSPVDPSIIYTAGAIKAACATAGITNVMDDLTDPWVTGVYNQPGSGNAPLYVADAPHPSDPEGNWNIANHLAAGLAKFFSELFH